MKKEVSPLGEVNHNNQYESGMAQQFPARRPFNKMKNRLPYFRKEKTKEKAKRYIQSQPSY